METFNIIALFFLTVAGCIVIDWHMRGLSERRFRQGLQAEAQSYLQPAKRI